MCFRDSRNSSISAWEAPQPHYGYNPNFSYTNHKKQQKIIRRIRYGYGNSYSYGRSWGGIVGGGGGGGVGGVGGCC